MASMLCAHTWAVLCLGLRVVVQRNKWSKPGFEPPSYSAQPQAENKFICPCHGSQYNDEGKVVRGPAPLSLALAHADVGENGVVYFSPW
eukprot:1162141-Pelagomonas_calceolata.AAC.1